MSIDKVTLLLSALEAEVAEAALELYLQTRQVPPDGRFEYRYRAARSVLESLRHGGREPRAFPRGDDDEATVFDDGPAGRRPLRERAED